MNLQALLAHRFPKQRVAYGAKDAILYALSVGAGADPLDPDQLRLVYEPELRPLPTLASVLAHSSGWLADPRFEVDYPRMLHGEQHLAVHRTLPPRADVEAQYSVPAVLDKGAGKGALVYFEKRLTDAASGEPLCTLHSTLFLRGDGGCGGFGTPPLQLPAGAPAREFTDEIKIASSAALLYRLNGDLNPIHVDPLAARKVGFDRPILHGLCTYGTVSYMLIRTLCGYDPSRLRSLGARFTAPVFPGETLRLEGARGSDEIHFQASVPERGQVVLAQGLARIA
jgi:acyl dehydratase